VVLALRDAHRTEPAKLVTSPTDSGCLRPVPTFGPRAATTKVSYLPHRDYFRQRGRNGSGREVWSYLDQVSNTRSSNSHATRSSNSHATGEFRNDNMRSGIRNAARVDWTGRGAGGHRGDNRGAPARSFDPTHSRGRRCSGSSGRWLGHLCYEAVRRGVGKSVFLCLGLVWLSGWTAISIDWSRCGLCPNPGLEKQRNRLD
jgi:hypothetical protein